MLPSVQLTEVKDDTTSPPLTTDLLSETKHIIREFLRRSGFKPRGTLPNLELRSAVTNRMVSMKSGDGLEVIEELVDPACAWAEIAYRHTSPEHRYFVALYTAALLYINDLGNTHLDAIRQFAARFTRGEKQLSPALDVLVDLLQDAHRLYTDVGADAIIAGTLDAVTAMYIEYTTQDMVFKAGATLFPYYLRRRTAICPPYIHSIFMRSWRGPTTDSYLQMMPYMERWLANANDILSFYKEQLAGETKNYVRMRASAEEITPINVLCNLCEEVLECDRKALALAGTDKELAEMWQAYVQDNLEFHVNTHRYRLLDFDV